MNSTINSLKHGDFSLNLLKETLLLKGESQDVLFALAREKRQEYFPRNEVEVRSVIEVSNICNQKCRYCSIGNIPAEKQYVIQQEELITIVDYIYAKGRRVLLLQSGENLSQDYIEYVVDCTKTIKQKYSDLVLILCFGSLSLDQYRQLRLAGAERYILKFETSNPQLYCHAKPNDTLGKRVESIRTLINAGFEVGTGNIVGLPGQTIESVAQDLLFLSEFNLKMASSSIFIPNENSAFRNEPMGDLDLTLNCMALMRIMYPSFLIPTTSSLESAGAGGQLLGLMAGANTVTIHDGTPEELKKNYPIYSTKRVIPNEEHIRNIVSKSGLVFPGDQS